MKLLFKQRFFSWFDSYEIYNEDGSVVFTVKGRMSWGHKLEIYNARGEHVGTLEEEVLTFLPRFRMYIEGQYIGEIKKEFTFFKPSFSLECNGWRVDGNFFEWDYTIIDSNRKALAYISKELLNFTDTYTIDVHEAENALMCLMVVLAIDAVKCSSRNG